MADRPVLGLVLAGGKSRRMGRDKALLDHDGQSQLAYLVELLNGSVDKVFVSTRPDQENDAERSQYEQIVDRYENLGPVAGILSALHEHPEVDWLVVACDLPNINEQPITHLLQQRDGEQPFTTYISSHEGMPEKLCAWFRSGRVSVFYSVGET